MITLQDLFLHLDSYLSKDAFADACPNGLQVEGKQNIAKLGVAVSASLAVIQKAAALQVDALLVHHGLFWQKDSFPIVGPKKDKLSVLLQNQMSLLAYHLPLDAHRTLGNNWKAATDLGWQNLKPFGIYNGSAIGVKGEFTPTEVDSFTKKLEGYYSHPAYCALGGKKDIRTAALISGGAHRAIEEAAVEGVDCFITGSFDEPIWDIAFERKINFFALGHHATERVCAIALRDHLIKEFSLPCEFIDLPNPF